MARLPSSISTEDLLNALESADDIETTEWSNDVPHFLSHFKFEQGDYKIKASLLYKLYRLYSKNPVPPRTFNSTAGQFIQYMKSYFRLNVKPVKIAKIVNTKTKDHELNFTADLGIKKHYEQFLQKCGVKKGKSWVEGQILYEIYRLYCIDNSHQKRLSHKNFIKITALYFTKKRINESRAAWFNIDNTIINLLLTEEDIERVNKRRFIMSDELKERHRKIQKEIIRGKKSKN